MTSTLVQDSLKQLWAKSEPYHSVPCHCIDVGVTAQTILEAPAFASAVRKLERAVGLTSNEGLRAWIGYLFSLHDFGKCEPHFQGKCPDLTGAISEKGYFIVPAEQCRGFRHETVSADFIKKTLKSLGWGRKAFNSVLVAIKAHHGNFTPRPHERAPGEAWLELQNELNCVLLDVFQPPQWSPTAFPQQAHASMLLSGLLVLSDWIASNAELFGLQQEPGERYRDYARRSGARARECLKALNLYELPAVETVQSFSEVWKGFTARGLQAACEEMLSHASGPGLLLAEAPMGEGKSELSVYAALRLNGLIGGGGFYIALPTSATSNQMFGRIKDFVETFSPAFSQSVRLAHGSAWVVDSPEQVTEGHLAATNDGEGERVSHRWAAEWFRPRRRSLLSPFAVGTVDQAMMAALNVKFGFLRWLGLASGALIVDEVHAYDTFMRVILHRLLQWCGSLEIPVILLSATLPSSLKRSFISAYLQSEEEPEIRDGYPLLSFYSRRGAPMFSSHVETAKSYELEVQVLEHALDNYEALARTALEEVRDGGCLCLLMNTVSAAQAVFGVLSNVEDPDMVLDLFHARFKMSDREKIEERVLALFDKRSSLDYRGDSPTHRPQKAILVATQVVEQSLDIDFDLMISQIAPVDLLLQRSGRVFRHRRERPAEHRNARLLVALPPEPEGRPRWAGSGRVYEHLYLLKTLALLRQKRVWRCPGDFRDLIEEVYAEGSQLEALVDPVLLSEARERFQNTQEELKFLGRQALINPPRADRHDLVGREQEVKLEAEEGKEANPLVATTRHGNSSVTVYALEYSESARKILEAERPPRRARLAELMKSKVSLPSYWLAEGVEAISDYLPPQSAPKWLGFGEVLWLQDGSWKARDGNGKPFQIRYAPKSGFHREVLNG